MSPIRRRTMVKLLHVIVVTSLLLSLAPATVVQAASLEVNRLLAARRGRALAAKALALGDEAIFYAPYDGSGPYETDFTGNPDDVLGGVTATTSGGVIFRPGRYGKGAQVAEGTTNLITNPSFEVDLATWSALGAGSTISRVTDECVYGTACVEVVCNGAGVQYGLNGQFYEGITEGRSYTFSGYVKADAPVTLLMLIHWYTSGGAWISQSFRTVAVTTDWTRYSVTGTAPATAAKARLQIRRDQTVAYTAWVDATQLEEKAYPTPYCDGSLSDDHSWSGTPHASTSSRTAAVLKYDGVVPRESFTVMGWFASSMREGETGLGVPGTIGSFFQIGDYYGNPGLNVMKWYSGGYTALYFKDSDDAGWTGTASQVIAFEPDEWFFIAVTYDGSQITYYAWRPDGTELSPVTIGDVGDGFGTGPNLSLRIGNSSDTTHAKNVFADDVAVFDRALSAGEVQAIYASGEPLLPPDPSEEAIFYAPYDGPGPYETDFTGNPDDVLGGVTATTSGGVIFRPGQYGKGVQVAEGTTNLVTNPSFETGTTGWWGNATLSQSDAYSFVGSHSLKAVTTAAGQYALLDVSSETSGGTEYTYSLYARGNGELFIFFWDDVSSSLSERNLC